MAHAHPATETRVFRSYWQDGSLDLVAGASVVGIGLAWNLDTAWAGAIIPAVSIPLWMGIRQRFVEPRLGHVTFSQDRRQKIWHGNLMAFALGCLALIIGVALYWIARKCTVELALIAGLPSFLIGLMALIVSFMLGLPRFLAYAGAFVVAGVAVAFADAEPGWGMLAGGAVTTVCGVVMLARFFKRFGLVPSEME